MKFNFAVLVSVALLVGCSVGESNVEKGNREGILHLGSGSEPQALDPHVISGIPGARIANALFEGLVTRNPYTLEIEPGVAQRWNYREDGKRITFHLRDQARWSNGDPVTAEDFVWSWRRALNPAMGNLQTEDFFSIVNAEAYSKGLVEDPAAMGFRALDSHTFEVTLREPDPYFLDNLVNSWFFPVHRATIEQHGKFTDRYTPWTRVGNMVGNGPFQLREWKLNKRILVEKSTTYWNADAMQLNGVVFHAIEGDAAAEHMFRARQLHVTDYVPLGKIPVYRKMPNSPLSEHPAYAIYFYYFNVNAPPVDDVRVRRALSMAVDRETLATTVLENSMVPLFSLTPPGVPGYSPPDMLRYDPEQATALMADAGYPNGDNWPGVEIIYNTAEVHHKIVVVLQQMWKKTLNIDVTITNQEWKVYLDTQSEQNFQISRAGRNGQFNPAAFLSLFLTGGGNNNSGFSSKKFDDLMLRSLPQTRTREQRLAVLSEAETLFMEHMPVMPLFTYKNMRLVHPSVQGLPGNMLNTVNLRYISLQPQDEDLARLDEQWP